MNETTNLTPPTSEGAPVPARPSSWASLARIFTSPRAVFADYAAKPSFLLPLIVVLVVHTGLGAIMSTSGVIREATVAQLEAKNTPPEQIEATERMMGSPVMAVVGTLGAAVGTAFAVLLGAALLYFMGNLMLGAKLTFVHYMCAAVFGSVVGLVDSAVRTILMLTRGDMHVRLGLGAFFGDATGFGVAFIDTLTGPLLLWSVAVVALGVAVFARKGFGFGILAALPGLVAGGVLAGLNG